MATSVADHPAATPRSTHTAELALLGVVAVAGLGGLLWWGSHRQPATTVTTTVSDTTCPTCASGTVCPDCPTCASCPSCPSCPACAAPLPCPSCQPQPDTNAMLGHIAWEVQQHQLTPCQAVAGWLPPGGTVHC